MEDEHPDRYTIGRDGNDDISATRAAIELGVTRGYSKYAARLKLLADPIVPALNIGEPTYEEPPKEVEQNG
jgi:hypothetical protein